MKNLTLLLLLATCLSGCALKAQTITDTTICGFIIHDWDSTYVSDECHSFRISSYGGPEPTVFRGECVTDSIAIDYLMKAHWSDMQDDYKSWSDEAHNNQVLLDNELLLEKRCKLLQDEINHINRMITILLQSK